MHVKNMLRVAAFAAAMAIAVPAKSNPVTIDPSQPVEAGADAKEIRAHQMVERLEEIKAMDKSTLSRSEKKELRKEVKAIRKEARDQGVKGIYLSIGAVIIIVLLLILIL